MSNFEGSTTVEADEQEVFDYLRDVRNLPEYFSRMTSAEPGEGEEVHTTAELPDGSEVEGDAWFRVDEENRTITWAAEGPDDYRGSLEVSRQPSGVRVAVHLHTTRVDEDDREVQQGIDATIEEIGKRFGAVDPEVKDRPDISDDLENPEIPEDGSKAE